MRVVTMTSECEAFLTGGGGAGLQAARRLSFDKLALGAVLSGGRDQRSGVERLRAVSRRLEKF